MKLQSIGLLVTYLSIGLATPAISQGNSCGGIAGATCADAQFCNYSATGTCGEGDQLGVCSPLPEFCTFEFNPVCGCDGVIYSNACMASAAGVSVASAEVCMERAATNVERLDCQNGASPQVIVCAMKDGRNEEYPNPCSAQEAGATNIVAKTGASCPATQ
ncbi:Kazal-type serine protease inhibitor domain-containing protein [uncultured Jannaschia sp.]|uniref:Kazal-type serine protease inhibitor domain-containing protein n=1 Tax=uncultured Jannaschia sp. TaxID=293347 RepID=UPI0034448045